MTQNLEKMRLIEDLKWRYATKKMTGEQIEQEKVDAIIEAVRLAPTSSGLQPYRIIQVLNPEVKAQLRSASYDQSQVTDCSHLLVFAAFDEYTEERVNEVFAQQERERGLPQGSSDDYKNGLLAGFKSQSAEQHFQHAARQAYIGFGVAIAAAAELCVDTTPMEGFENAKVDEILGLEKLGLKSVTLLAIGQRDVENDWLVNLKKVRTATEDFVITVK